MSIFSKIATGAVDLGRKFLNKPGVQEYIVKKLADFFLYIADKAISKLYEKYLRDDKPGQA